jgi:hypothetical protein
MRVFPHYPKQGHPDRSGEPGLRLLKGPVLVVGYKPSGTYAAPSKLIGKIHLPETCANLCIGGGKRNRLFMAASQSLYAVYVNAQNAQQP